MFIVLLAQTAMPQPHFPGISGSPLWQLAFVSFALVLVLFEVVRGWRRGIARQLARLGALIGGYLAAYFGGPIAAPFLAPMVHIPEVAMSIVLGSVFFVIVYAMVSGMGTVLFRRTAQHSSAVVRLVYGVSGAVLGIFFGAFLVWVVIVGIRSLGALAEMPAQQQAANSDAVPPPHALHAVDLRRGELEEQTSKTSVLMSLARLKNSLEMGTVGALLKRADVVPTNTYETFGKLGQVVSSPERAERFLTFPGAKELSEHPRIVALREDPEITQLIEQGRFIDLLQNQKVLDALDDPTLIDQIKGFDLQRALDYAINGNPAPR